MEILRCDLSTEDINYFTKCRVYLRDDSSSRKRTKRDLLSTTKPKYKIVSNLTKEAKPQAKPQVTPQLEPKKGRGRGRPRKYPRVEEEDIPNTSKKTMKASTAGYFQSSFEEYIKPSLKPKEAAVAENESNMHTQDSEANTTGEFLEPEPSIARPLARPKPRSDCESYYWLNPMNACIKPIQLRKMNYDFKKLVVDVKYMKLPSSDWKIKIMVHKQEMISISFLYKLTPEKTVVVNTRNGLCDLTLNGNKIVLIASPLELCSVNDLETLLEIMDKLSLKSNLIQYVN